MTISHVATTRENLATRILTDLGVNAQMVLRTSGDAEVATLTLPNPSGSVSGSVLSLGAFTDDTNATGGTVTNITFETSGGTEVFGCASSGDGITLSSSVIGATDTVQSGTITYTAPV